MANIKVFNLEAIEKSEVAIPSSLIVDTPNKQAMFDQVLAENAGARQGTHSTLTKGEVRGGGIKPRPQKHTGQARQGSIRNPHWVGGGIAFGPKPTRNYKLYLNSKVSKLALASAVTAKVHSGSIFGLDDKISLDKPSAKAIAKLINELKFAGKNVLIIANTRQTNLVKSATNVNRAVAKIWNQVSTKDIMNAAFVLIQETALFDLGKVVA